MPRKSNTADDGRQERHDEPKGPEGTPGRSEMSPGHLKKAAGARSAREFAPGQARKRQG